MDFPSGQPADLVDLIRAYPLAWLVTCGEAGFEATPLPLVPETDEAGELVALIGHCSRNNAQTAALREDPRAFALFMGPQGYISPDLVSQPRWVPTWDFAVAILALEVELTEAGTAEAVRQLVDAAEADRPRPWRMEDGGERIEQLMRRIIGFRARVVGCDVRLKLGQEESLPTVTEIIAGIEDGALRQWMQRLNADRLDAAGESEIAGK